MDDFVGRFQEEVERIGGPTAISRDLGGSRNTVYNWIEKGNVPLNRLIALGRVMGMDVLYVITGERSQASLSQEEGELLSLYRGAPLAVKMAAVGALQGAASAQSKRGDGNRFVVKGDGNRVAGGDYHRHTDKKK